MKKITNLIGTLGLILAVSTGCVSIPLTPSQITTIGTVITQVANQGAIYAIQQDNRNAAYFKAAIPLLDNFASGTDLTPAALQMALSNTTLGTNQWVGLAISAVVIAYDMSYSQYIANQLTNAPAAKEWIIALETGFKQATGTALSKLAKPTPPTFIVNGKVDRAVIKAKVKAAAPKK